MTRKLLNEHHCFKSIRSCCRAMQLFLGWFFTAAMLKLYSIHLKSIYWKHNVAHECTLRSPFLQNCYSLILFGGVHFNK